MDPQSTAYSTGAAYAPTASGGGAYGVASGPGVAVPWAQLEVPRSRLHRCGVLLILLGIWALWGAWIWVTAALAIASGAVLVDTFASAERMQGKATGAVQCCGRERARRREDDCEPCSGGSRQQDCCCAPWHSAGLLMATIVFALVDLAWAIPVAALQAPSFARGEGPLCTDPYYTKNYPRFCNEAYRDGLRYQAFAFRSSAVTAGLVVAVCGLALYW